MAKFTETEVKLKVDDLAAVARALEGLGAALESGRTFERNVRYEDAGETLTPAKRVLRLRQDERVRLTYKEPPEAEDGADGADNFTRTELEVTVSDFEQADQILQKLGFHPAWVYEKYRTTYALEGCEIVLDELPIGVFIEIEGDAACISSLIERLKLGESQRLSASYSDLFFYVKDHLQLAFRDMTFDNFRGIAVPGALWAAW